MCVVGDIENRVGVVGGGVVCVVGGVVNRVCVVGGVELYRGVEFQKCRMVYGCDYPRLCNHIIYVCLCLCLCACACM